MLVKTTSVTPLILLLKRFSTFSSLELWEENDVFCSITSHFSIAQDTWIYFAGSKKEPGCTDIWKYH